MKIVINKSNSEFQLSLAAQKRIIELKLESDFKDTNVYLYQQTQYKMINGTDLFVKRTDINSCEDNLSIYVYYIDYGDTLNVLPQEGYFNISDLGRTDNDMACAVEELGEIANGGNAKLKVEDVPVDVDWIIENTSNGEKLYVEYK